MSKVKVEEIYGHQFFSVDKVIQSVLPPPKGGIWPLLVPDFPVKKVLILGFGAGSVAKAILEKSPDCEILGLDYNEEMLEEARKQNFPPKLKLIRQDIFDFLDSYQDKFDYVCVDLFEGHWFPVRLLQGETLAKLKDLVAKGGKLAINLPDFPKLWNSNFKMKVEKVLSPEMKASANLVVWAVDSE